VHAEQGQAHLLLQTAICVWHPVLDAVRHGSANEAHVILIIRVHCRAAAATAATAASLATPTAATAELIALPRLQPHPKPEEPHRKRCVFEPNTSEEEVEEEEDEEEQEEEEEQG